MRGADMNPDRLAFHVANKRCVELMDEVEKLRDLLRWRKWPEEKPNENTKYQVFFEYTGADGNLKTGMEFSTFFRGQFFGYTCGFEKFYWRPIGPLPGEGGE